MIQERSELGRKTYIVQCRETGGVALGGGLAFPGTLSETEKSEVVVIAMSSSSRHVTKPVCQITYALRDAGVGISVLVLSSGAGGASDLAPATTLGSSLMDITPIEVARIMRHKLAIIHVGNVPSHFIPKIKKILENAKIASIVICQAPLTFDDLERQGVRTIRTKIRSSDHQGLVVDIVSGVVRGQFCPIKKLNEIIKKTKTALTLIPSKNLLNQ